MGREALGATLRRLALAVSILALGAATPVIADETHVPTVAKKQLSPGETQTLNPQPIPPGKSATVGKSPKTGGENSIIFVGGKKAAAAKSDANVAAPSPKTAKASTKARAPQEPQPCPPVQICLP